MKRNGLIITLLAIAVSVFATSDIAVDPASLSADLLSGDVEVQTLNVANEGDTDLTWSLTIMESAVALNAREHGFYADESRNNAFSNSQFPRSNHGSDISPTSREEGDVLAEYYEPYPNGATGMAWAANELYVIAYMSEEVYKVNPETGELISSFPVNAQPYGMTYDGQYLWIGNSSGNVYGYDLDGTEIGSFTSPVSEFMTLAWDGQYFIISDTWTIINPTFYKVDYEGDVVATYTSSFGDYLAQTVWVQAHDGGNLWGVHDLTGDVRRFDLSGGVAVEVSSFSIPIIESRYAIAHNGTDLWIADWNGPYYQIDDGIEELTWLYTDIVTGTVPAGTSQDITVTFDASGMIGGDYASEIIIANNDPDENPVIVPATLGVTGAPSISLNPDVIDFGELYIDGTYTETIIVYNSGTDVLDVTDVAVTGGEFSADGTLFSVAAGGYYNLDVTFTPTFTGLQTGDLTLSSNDPTNPTISADLSGTGVTSPDIAWDPTSMSADLFTGDAEVQILTLTNEGGSDLIWELSIEEEEAFRPMNVWSNQSEGDTRRSFTGELNRDNTQTLAIQERILRNLRDSTMLFYDDMESGTNGWTTEVYMVDDLWHQSETNFNSPVASWWCGIEGMGNYETGQTISTAAISPAIDLTGIDTTITLQFFENYETEGGYDYCMVDVSTDGGGTWIPQRGGLGEAPSGSSEGWISTVLDLTAYQDQVIQIRFYFDTMDEIANDFPGWFFDDVLVYAAEALVTWVYTDVESGVLPAGFTQDIEVVFDAGGMIGGDYSANIFITSNDPDELPIIPATLNVTGAPSIDLDPDAIDYGEQYVDGTYPTIIEVSNGGTDLLDVTDIQIAGGEFGVDGTLFSLSPGESHDLEVIWTPTTVGLQDGVLTLTSNDPTNPSVEVALSGSSVTSPDIAWTPTSMSADLFTGDSEIQTLTITNEGGSNLDWEIDSEMGEPIIADRSPAEIENIRNNYVPDATDNNVGLPHVSAIEMETFLNREGDREETVHILGWSAFSDPDGEELNTIEAISWYFTDFTIVNTPTLDPATLEAELEEKDLFLVYEQESGGGDFEALAASLGPVLQDFVSSGGGIIFCGMSSGNSGEFMFYTGFFDGMWLSDSYSYGIPLSVIEEHDVTAGVEPNFFDANATFYVDITNDDALKLVQNDEDLSDVVTVREYGSGRAVYMGFDYYDFDSNVAQLIANAVQWAGNSSRVDWLSFSEEGGTLAAGASLDIDVTFDASDMIGGEYTADIIITSNDPDENPAIIPATLNVTGAPSISVEPGAVDYGEQYVGGTYPAIIEVSNGGTDLLDVTDIQISGGEFSVDGTLFSLSPGEAYDLEVTWTPTTVGLHEGVLTLTSNDPSNPSLDVTLTGSSVTSPDIAWDPTSMSADLFTGDTETQTLTLTNEGGSDLIWSIAFEETDIARIDRNIGFYADETRSHSLHSVQLPQSIIENDQHVNSIRDEGDVLGEYWSPDPNGATGAVWVDDDLYVLSWAMGTVQKVNPFTGELISAFTPEGNMTPYGIIYDGEYLWIGTDYGNIYGYDLDGNLVGSFSSPIEDFNAIAWDGEYFIVSQTWNLINPVFYRIDYTGNVIETYSSSFDDYISQMTWVPGHDGGNLWTVHDVTGEVRRFDLIESAAVEFSSFYLELMDFRLAVAHDGIDLWIVEFNGPYFQIDDGIEEANWLFSDIEEGTISAGASQDIQITFDATGMFGGDYFADIVITSNDPNENPAIIPAALNVTGAPSIDLDPDVVDFGEQYVGGTYPTIIEVSNGGTDLLDVTDIQISGGEFSVDGTLFSLSPGESYDLEVTWTPTIVGLQDGVLTLISNDPSNPTVTIPLTGSSVTAPDIAWDPTSMSADLFTGDIETQTLTLTNEGGSDLDWSISFEETELARNDRNIGFYADESRVARDNSAYHALLAQSNTGNTTSRDGSRDIGDILAEHYNYTIDNTGDVWADGSLYSVTWADNFLSRYDFGSEQMVVEFEIISDAHGMTFDGNYFWIADGVGNVYGYDFDGNQIGSFSTPIEWYMLITWDGEYFIVNNAPDTDQSNPYYRIDYEGSIIETINSTYEGYSNGAVWVDGHDDGELWVNDFVYGAFVQLHQEGDQYIVVNQFYYDEVGLAGYDISHDGTDLWSSSAGDVLYQIDDGIEEANWLYSDISEGVIAAGGSQDVLVTFDATGMFGGEYTADIIVTSNDPNENPAIIPATLNVTGAPSIDLDPDVVAYGDQYVGGTYPVSVEVSNGGTDLLDITDIQISGGEFSVDGTLFSLSPGEGYDLEVTWTPTSVGFQEGELTLTSNDPTNPTVIVPLSGTSVTAPDIAWDPTSMSADLFTGDSETQTLTLTNEGGSDLIWELNFADPLAMREINNTIPEIEVPIILENSTSPHAPIPSYYGTFGSSRTDEEVLVVRDNLPWGGDVVPLWLELETIVTVISSFDLAGTDLGDYDVMYWGGDESFTSTFYNNIAAKMDDISDFLANGGIVFSATGSQGGTFVLPGDVMASNASGSVQYLEEGYCETEGVPVEVWGNSSYHDTYMNFDGVPDGVEEFSYGEGGEPVGISYDWGFGRAIFIGNPFEYYLPDGGGNPEQIDMWMASARCALENTEADWLTSDIQAGVISAGGSQEILITFDATGMFGGEYSADIVISSNDPNENPAIIPATLNVTGASHLEVDQTTLDFGEIFIDGSLSYDLMLSNTGTDVLEITAIQVSGGDFSADASTASLAPGEEYILEVTFAPTNTDTQIETLTLVSNDPSNPELVIDLSGTGLVPPDITWDPDFMESELYIGEVETQILTITNDGGSALDWNLNVHEMSAVDLAGDIGFYADESRTPLPDAHLLPNLNEVGAGDGSPRDEGDILGEYWAPDPNGATGMAWIGDALYVVSFVNEEVLRVNPVTGELISSFPVHNSAYGLAWDGQHLWIGDGSGNIYGYTLDGDLVGSFSSPEFGHLTLTWDGANFLVAAAFAFNPTIYKVNYSGDVLDDYQTSFESSISQMVWVSSHEDGNLWTVDESSGVVRRLDMSGSYFNEVSNFSIPVINFRYAITHDGYDLWIAEWNGPYYQVDDGIEEQHWIYSDITAGNLAPGSSQDIEITFSALEVLPGDYAASIFINSNDPDESEVTIPVSFTVNTTGLTDITELPETYVLQDNFPNPFNPSTTLFYGIPEESDVSLIIYDIRGHVVTEVASGRKEAGWYDYVWQGMDRSGHTVATGVYFARFQAGDYTRVVKMVYLK